MQGKSLSLLTSALTWLRHEQVRQLNGELQAYRSTLEQEAAESLARGEPPDPPWVMEKLVNRKRSELESAKERMEEKLRRAREDEKERARRAEYGERARGEGVSDRASKKAVRTPLILTLATFRILCGLQRFCHLLQLGMST